MRVRAGALAVEKSGNGVRITIHDEPRKGLFVADKDALALIQALAELYEYYPRD